MSAGRSLPCCEALSACARRFFGLGRPETHDPLFPSSFDPHNNKRKKRGLPQKFPTRHCFPFPPFFSTLKYPMARLFYFFFCLSGSLSLFAAAVNPAKACVCLFFVPRVVVIARGRFGSCERTKIAPSA
ncbi:hypothetical protein [Pandoravirus japonicus]|uniref:Transmembrane protein n=1 Tax=Pandoravirus japonicus TaxID=2823154 RepID=A0A811BR37_9VIRU|nr:hypothetical protein [Pandoravirus japonicus]